MNKPAFDQFGLLGHTILTSEGYYLDFDDPNPGTICIEDIATGLSNLCRFAGQIPGGRWYSVAEHCVAGAMAMLDQYRDPWDAFGFLMHDASEAYTGDCPKPLKMLLPDFKLIEDRVQSAIAAIYGLDTCDANLIRYWDMRMLKAEKLNLFPQNMDSWTGFDSVEAAPVTIENWPPAMARKMFLALFEQLCPKGRQ